MSRRSLGIFLLALGGLVVVVSLVGLIAGGEDATENGEAAGTTTMATTTLIQPSPTTLTTPTTPTTTSTTTSSTTTTTTTLPPAETAEEFLEKLNNAFDSGDAVFLFARLNQVTLDIYGPEQCQAYLDSPVVGPQDLVFRELVGVGPWDYVIDGITTPVDEVVAVEVSRLVDGQTIVQELHWKLVDGEYTWFTDCGDPLG